VSIPPSAGPRSKPQQPNDPEPCALRVAGGPRSGFTRRGVLAGSAAALVSSAGPFAPIGVAAAPARMSFADLYARFGILSDEALALTGAEIEMRGYMAPPLKPEVTFFVLTKLPMSVCPFCESEAQWPDDIVLVRSAGAIEVVRYTELIRVVGTLETGKAVDAETGFLSLVRIVDARYERL